LGSVHLHRHLRLAKFLAAAQHPGEGFRLAMATPAFPLAIAWFTVLAVCPALEEVDCRSHTSREWGCNPL
jgi:hypothetical protein